MHQIWNDNQLEVILELLKERGHARELSKKLSIPLTTLLRILQGLQRKNVVEYRQEGKNKVYELRKTPEARIYVLNAENYKLLKVMRKYSQLTSIIKKIQENRDVKLAVLSGAYAEMKAGKDSKIEIFIEGKLGKDFDRKIKLTKLELK